MEFKRTFPGAQITISPTANNGFILQKGCFCGVFEKKDALLKALDEYLSDPKGHSERYSRLPGAAPPMEGGTAETVQETALYRGEGLGSGCQAPNLRPPVDDIRRPGGR